MSAIVERIACPACAHPQYTTLLRMPFTAPQLRSYFERKYSDPQTLLALLDGAHYELRRCPACTLIYQGRILSDAYTTQLYDNWLIDDDMEHDPSRKHPVRAQLGYYANEIIAIGRLIDKPQPRILDYGMGQGWWCRVAAAFGFDVWGTDLSDQLLALARESGLQTLPMNEVGSQLFDFINTEQVFEHLAEPLAVLKKLRQSLKPGGIIKISVPPARGIERQLPQMDWTVPRGSQGYLIPVTPLIHINTFPRDAIYRMGAVAGLTPTKLSLAQEYSLLDATSLKSLAKSFLRPLYRRYSEAPYVFLKN